MTGTKEKLIILKAYSWDWKEQPDFTIVNRLINELGRKPIVYAVEDGSDQHGILITNLEGLNEQQALEYYYEVMQD